LLEERVVKELVFDLDGLTLEKHLQQVLQTGVLEGGFESGHLVFALELELAEDAVHCVALGAAEEAVEERPSLCEAETIIIEP
jgi:hypothetical protein